MATITRASSELCRRTPDESHETLIALHNACVEDQKVTRQETANIAELEAVVIEGNDPTDKANVDTIGLRLPSGKLAKFGNWSLGQTCKLIEMPQSAVERMTPKLAVDVINNGFGSIVDLKKKVENLQPWEIDDGKGRMIDADVKLISHMNGDTLLRSVVTPRYNILFNADVTSFLLDLADEFGLEPAPKAYNGYRGLYKATDGRDMFAFLVDNNRRIFESDPTGAKSRYIMAANSETGALILWLAGGYYDYICGNHMVWGAEQAFEVSVKHTAKLAKRFDRDQIMAQAKNFLEAPTDNDEAFIKLCQKTNLGENKEEVVEKVLALRQPILGKRFLGNMFDLAEQHSDMYGSPKSVWGMASAITETARNQLYANTRVNLESAATKVLEIVKN